MLNRRLLLLFVVTSLFAIIVLVWYFFFTTPKQAPTLGTPNNTIDSFPSSRFQFITDYFSNDEDPTENTTTTEVTEKTAQVLTQIWDKPTTGQTFVSTISLREIVSTSTVGTSTKISVKLTQSTSSVLLFVDRVSGYVYSHNLENGETMQISNSTIPGVYDAFIFNKGKQILIRYLDADRTTIISIVATIPVVKINGTPLPLENITYLPKNISSVSVSASSEKISFLVPSSFGSSFYTITTKGQTLTASSPFSEWSLTYGGEQLFATSKPSAYVEGQTVLIPSFTLVVGGKTGLMSTPSSFGSLIHSMWSSRGLASFLTIGGETRVLSEKTISSKCADGKNFFICGVPKTIPSSLGEGLPDEWYQGGIMFSDSIVLVDAKTGDIYPLFDFDANQPTDITHPISSKDSSLFGFIRKQDGSLWLLRINLISVD